MCLNLAMLISRAALNFFELTQAFAMTVVVFVAFLMVLGCCPYCIGNSVTLPLGYSAPSATYIHTYLPTDTPTYLPTAILLAS